MIPWFVAAAPASIIPIFSPLLPFVWACIFRFARGGESTRNKFYGLIMTHYVGAVVVAAIHPFEEDWRSFWRMWDYYPLAVLLWLAVYLYGNWLVWH